MSVSQLGHSMGWPEFIRWAAFYELEERGDSGGGHRGRARGMAREAIRHTRGGSG